MFNFTWKCFNISWMARCHARNQSSRNVSVEKKNISVSNCEQDSGCHGNTVEDRPADMLVFVGHRTSDGVWNNQNCNKCCDVCSEHPSL